MTSQTTNSTEPARTPEQVLSGLQGREATIEVMGSTTHYWVYTQGNETLDERPTIVLVHGFRGDHHGLLLLTAGLRDYRVIVPDLPGFGRSQPFPQHIHNLAGYVEWLTLFTERIRPTGTTLYLLGHSFGSIIASSAVAGGLAVDRLILVNPIGAPALSGPRGILTRFAVFYYWLGAVLPNRLGYALLTNRLIVRITSIAMVKTSDKHLRRWIHQQHDRYFSVFASREVVLEAFRASVSSDVSSVADGVTAPTLLIAAEHDDITALPAQRKLLTRFANARLDVIPRVGHLVHYETPEEAVTAITTYLMTDD
ncbi:alpha/beta fold hydrolase [Klugiella xanthotipulae]|nr:alpha/beta hydrolase [Klugiella xanthotipulae]